MNKNTGIEYEKLTQKVFEQIVNQNTVKTINVQHDIVLPGKTTNHQIDVYWEFDLNGIKYRTIIQAKDWNSKVPQVEMLAFKAILDDLPTGTKGIYVTKNGYQSGAVDVAKAQGISIYTLRKPTETDWDGKIKTIELDFVIKTMVYENLNIVFDKEWFKNNTPNGKDYQGNKTFSGETELVNEEGIKLFTLKDIIMKLVENSPNTAQKQTFKFEQDTYIYLDEFVKAKVLTLSGVFGHKSHTEHLKIDGENIVGLILKDILCGKTFTFDKNQTLISENVK